MTTTTKIEYIQEVARRYQNTTSRKNKSKILDEFCATIGYNRKYAIWKLKNTRSDKSPAKRIRKNNYVIPNLLD